MVSCLTLINSTHGLARHVDGLDHTLCGLAIATADATAGLITSAPGDATCLRCQNMLRIEAASRSAAVQRPDTRTLVTRLVDHLNANDAAHLADTLDGPLLGSLSAQRMSRLHQLFPGWHATIDELIADETNAVLRFRVDFADAFGLLGAIGPSFRAGQAVVFRLANHRITDACPVVDDFAFWSGLAKGGDAACANCTTPSDFEEGIHRDSPYP